MKRKKGEREEKKIDKYISKDLHFLSNKDN